MFFSVFLANALAQEHATNCYEVRLANQIHRKAKSRQSESNRQSRAKNPTVDSDARKSRARRFTVNDTPKGRGLCPGRSADSHRRQSRLLARYFRH
jgi:hypothetical protein